LVFSERIENIVNFNIKRMPSRFAEVPDPFMPKKLIYRYVDPFYFLNILFVKKWKKQRRVRISLPMRLKKRQAAKNS